MLLKNPCSGEIDRGSHHVCKLFIDIRLRESGIHQHSSSSDLFVAMNKIICFQLCVAPVSM